MRLTTTIVLILFLCFNINAQRIPKNKVVSFDASSSIASYMSNLGEISEVEVDLKYIKKGVHVHQLFSSTTGDKFYSIVENGTTLHKYPKDLFEHEIAKINLNMPDPEQVTKLVNTCNEWIMYSLKNKSSFKPLWYQINTRHRNNGKKLYTIYMEFLAKNSYGGEVEGKQTFELNDKLKLTTGWVLSNSLEAFAEGLQ